MKFIVYTAILLALRVCAFADIKDEIPLTNQVILNIGAWKPTAEQTQKALASIQTFLNQTKHREVQKILAHTKHYRVQFVGELRSGKKVIWCNFFPASENNGADDPAYWKHDKVVVYDGGFWYWRIDYDPEADGCSNLAVNGYA